jgi:hypothetical protein
VLAYLAVLSKAAPLRCAAADRTAIRKDGCIALLESSANLDFSQGQLINIHFSATTFILAVDDF